MQQDAVSLQSTNTSGTLNGCVCHSMNSVAISIVLMMARSFASTIDVFIYTENYNWSVPGMCTHR